MFSTVVLNRVWMVLDHIRKLMEYVFTFGHTGLNKCLAFYLENPPHPCFCCPVMSRLHFCLSTKRSVMFLSLRFVLHFLPEKYDYVGRLLKPGDEPSEYTDEEDIKDHLKHDWKVPSLRPKPGAPNSCDRPPQPPRPLPPLPPSSPALLASLPLPSPAPLPKLFTPESVRWRGCSGRAEFRCQHADVLPSPSRRDHHQQKAIDRKTFEELFLTTANTSGGSERARAIRCIWKKTLKYFNHLSRGGKCGRRGRRRPLGGGWSEVVRETHWSEMISGLGRGNRFLSFYLWFSHIATETASASDSLSINHFYVLFESFSPLVQRAVLWPNQRQLAGRRIFLLCL